MPSSSVTLFENIRTNHEEFKNGEIHLKSRPTVLFIELTQNCNLHCRMCRASAGYQKDLNMDRNIFNRLKAGFNLNEDGAEPFILYNLSQPLHRPD